MKFKINPYYRNKNIDFENVINKVTKLVNKYKSDKDLFKLNHKLLGVGNEAKSDVFRLDDTEFCIKISEFSKHVGRNQERQFDLNNQCLQAVSDKTVEIEGDRYSLTTTPSVAVTEDDKFAYTIMFELKNAIRLWDEDNIPFEDKNNWDVIREIKRILKEYANSKNMDEEKFLADMDVNGNNLMVDVDSKTIYLIDPYVPAELEKFEVANTFAYGHLKRLVAKDELALFEVNSSIEMHILRHFKKVSDEYKRSLLNKEYHYFDHQEKKFKQGVIKQVDIDNALNTKGTKFAEFVSGIENPKKLLKWLRGQTVKQFNEENLYTVEKGLESKIYMQFEYPGIVGEIDVINYDELTEDEKARVKKVKRSEGHDEATEINIIEGKEKIPTKEIAFLLHKVPELDFYFGSAFPGYLDPDFATEDEDKKYWENLVFIKTADRLGERSSRSVLS